MLLLVRYLKSIPGAWAIFPYKSVHPIFYLEPVVLFSHRDVHAFLLGVSCKTVLMRGVWNAGKYFIRDNDLMGAGCIQWMLFVWGSCHGHKSSMKWGLPLLSRKFEIRILQLFPYELFPVADFLPLYECHFLPELRLHLLKRFAVQRRYIIYFTYKIFVFRAFVLF